MLRGWQTLVDSCFRQPHVRCLCKVTAGIGKRPVVIGKEPVGIGKEPLGIGKEPVRNGKEPVCVGKEQVLGIVFQF